MGLASTDEFQLWIDCEVIQSGMSLSHLVLVYVAVFMGAIAALSIWDLFRQRRFDSGQNRDTVFRCAKCGYVYTDDFDVDRSRCPQCGVTNEPFKF